MKLAGSRILLTGATGGIGRCLALELLRRGALLALVGLMPWTPLLPAVHSALTQARRPAVGLAALWSAVVLVFFSAANAKRSVYLLPMYPAVAILTATGLVTTAHVATRRLAALYRPALAAFAVLAILLAAGVDVASLLRDVLELEGSWSRLRVPKERAVRERLGLSLGRYHQLLDRAIDRPEALAHDPMLVLRLRRLRETRRRVRAPRAIGLGTWPAAPG